MAITNQQIADSINLAIEAMERIFVEMVKTNRELAAKNEAEHAEFRQAQVEVSKTLVLLQERQDRQRQERDEDRAEQRKLWGRVWSVVIAPILGGIVIAVLALVLK